MKRVSAKIENNFLNAYDLYSDQIYRHCFFRVSDEERATDLVADTFTKVWQYLAQGGEIKNIRAFLYKVANNLIIDHYRKKKTTSLDQLAEDHNFDPPENTHEKIEQESEIHLLTKTLDKLEDEYKEVMIMRYIDGLSIKEISEIKEESQNAVSVRLHRATNKMKEILKI